MSLQVHVHPKAEDELISLYTDSSSKGLFDEAWNDIEQFLKFVPETQGKPVDFAQVDDVLAKTILSRLLSLNAFGNSLWIITRRPLQAFYTIHRDDGFVRIWHMRVIPRS